MSDDPQALACRLLETGNAPAQLPPEAASAPRLALAWAFKHECQAAWTREPARARQCAGWLALLAADSTADGPLEVGGVAAWTRGIAELTEGRMADALHSLDTAAAAFTALGHTRHAAEAEVPRLIALSMLGRHDEAVQAGERARQRFIDSAEPVAAGKVELNLGSMLLRLDRYADAARHYRSAALRFAQAGDTEHSVMADIGLATVLTWQFQFDEAQTMYARAAHRARVHGLHALQGVIDSSRGRLELHRGHHADALRWLAAGLQAFETQGNPQSLAEARRHLADAYLALNLLAEAQALYDSAITQCRAIGAPVEEAWATVQRAQTLARQGALDAAAQDLAAAEALFSTHGNDVGAGVVALHSAGLQRHRHDSAGALAQARRAAAIFAGAGIRGWQLDAEATAAEALADAGRHDEAVQAFEATLQAAGGLAEIAARCHTGIGLLHRARGESAAAQAALGRAVAAIERQRAGLPGDEFAAAYGADKQVPYDALVSLALDARAPDASHLLHCMEQARSQALRLGLQRAAGTAAEAPLASSEAWHWLHEQWRQALAGGRTAQAAALQPRLQAAESAWLEACRRLQASAAQELAAAPPALDIGALQAALGAGTALVEYARVGQRLAVCVLTPDGRHQHSLDARGLDERIARLRDQLDTLRHAAPGLRAHAAQLAQRVTSHLRALHAQLWAPLQPLLAGCEQVVVVPHGSLHYVPFCALHDGRRFLVEHMALVHAPSAALWLDSTRRPAAALQRVLALGVGGEQLPHVAGEVHAVAAAFGGAATVLLDAAATLPALRAGLDGADVLHLACHGQFRADSPYFSALHLADGPLTLRDAAALPLQAALVTLSACETGLSRIAPGDELLGLVRGFLLAGAPSVLASLWTVDDASTALLMGAFYRRLRGGAGGAQALRLAQCEALRQHPHPYHWAAFSLHGRG